MVPRDVSVYPHIRPGTLENLQDDPYRLHSPSSVQKILSLYGKDRASDIYNGKQPNIIPITADRKIIGIGCTFLNAKIEHKRNVTNAA